MVPGQQTVVAPGETGRAAAAGLVQWKDLSKPPPKVKAIEARPNGWKNQVGKTIESKPMAKRKKA